jgi:hypothetical protein
MFWRVKYTHDKHVLYKNAQTFFREGKEIYRHPKGYFVTLELQGKGGKFNESFRLSELIPI